MKFPKQNPFAVPPACWQLRFLVPMEAALAVEDAFEEDALSVSSFEVPEDPFTWQVIIHLAVPPTPETIKHKIDAVGAALKIRIPPPTLEEVPQEDWRAALERDFPPVRAARFFVHGEHAKHQAPWYALPVQVEAGAAFGSGEHATTHGCLLALDRIARERNVENMLDMGCGSGILAIAAARLWPGARILAADNDAPSVRVARENIRINRVGSQVRAIESNGYANKEITQNGPYDVIVANILARPLVKLSRALVKHLRPGGLAVLSGLLDSQASMVIAAHRRQGLHLDGRIHEHGWATLIMEKP